MQQGSPLFHLRRKEASAGVPAAEAFFQTIAARLRARMVNRSASDIPIRVSGVEVRQLGEVRHVLHRLAQGRFRALELGPFRPARHCACERIARG